MMKIVRFNFWIALLGLLSFAGCKEDDNGESGTSYTDNYRFYVDALVDGLPLRINAGENDYAMYTSYQLQDSLLLMHGLLAQDSQDIRNALQIFFRSAELGSQYRDFDPLGTLQNGKVAVADGSGHTQVPQHFDFDFFPDTVLGNQAFYWSVQDSSYHADTCRVIGLNADLENHLDVSLNSPDPANCPINITKGISTLNTCKAEVRLGQFGNDLALVVEPRIGSISAVRWFRGGQPIGNGTSFILPANLVGQIAEIKAEIDFASGCTEAITKEMLISPAACDVSINYRKKPHLSYNPHNLNTVEIVYYDQNGKRFTSLYPNTEGDFELMNTASYQDPNSGYHHQQFNFSGELLLRSRDGSTKSISKLFGSFAVAHP
jgi:hypothetical protein